MKNISEMDGEDMALYCAYCGYCGAEIALKRTSIGTGKRTRKRPWKRKRNVHINICQEPSIIYFCNQNCKLNWIFKRPDLELDREIKSNWVKEEVKSTFDTAGIEDNTEELKKYLKENKVKIIRQA
jgi:hypothetical protein